jgi:Ca2+-binding EF-hand superfamily protein
MRTLYWSIPVLLLLAAGPAVAQDRSAHPKNSSASGKGSGATPSFFDVDRFLKEYDRNKDGFLTRDELPERLRHNFDRMDTNNDGKLSREEVVRGIVYLQPRRRPSDVVYILIEMSDSDEEAAAELQRAYDVLRRTDRNRDGKINPDELKAMRLEIVGERVAYLIKELDANKDGRISREEARGEILRNFDRLDRNKDGYIDRDELLYGALEKVPESPHRGPDPLPRKPAVPAGSK